MEGPWGSLDPDVVDQETGNFWRGLYKLEKQFNEVPKAQSIAVKVSTYTTLHPLLVAHNY